MGNSIKCLQKLLKKKLVQSETPIKKPQIVVSLLCTLEKAYLGISPTSTNNLSDWPGGARHFAHLPEQISRAEFKLLEALEVFGVTLPSQGMALESSGAALEAGRACY